MNMITRKKLIAALLIPIMLIAFSAPTFAAVNNASTGGSSLSSGLATFAEKALNLTLDLAGESFKLVQTFAKDFMGITDVNGALELSGNLITQGIGSVTDLIGIFTRASYTPEEILPLLWELLGFTVKTAFNFADTIFLADLSSPSGVIKFASDLLGFSINAGKTLVGVVVRDLDLGDLGGMLTGSVGDLSGILNMLLPGEGQPSVDVSNLLGNFDFIGFLGSITDMGGIGDFTEPLVGLLENFFGSATTLPETPITNTMSNTMPMPNPMNNTSTENEAAKPDITTPPATDNDSPSYTATVEGQSLRLVCSPTLLTNILASVDENKIHDGSINNSKQIATYYVKMILGKVDVASVSLDRALEANWEDGQGVLATVDNLQKAVAQGKPSIVHIDKNYWVTCVGYRNDGSDFKDFLFVDPITGGDIFGEELSRQGFYSMNANGGIVTFN